MKAFQSLKGYLILLAGIPLTLSGQAKYTLSGKVTDSATGEDLIGAYIVVERFGAMASTNSYGFYSVSLPAGKYAIGFKFIGYEYSEKIFDLDRNLTVDVEMKPSLTSLNEITITFEKDNRNVTSVMSGMGKIDMKEIKKMPSFLGERDILKSLQLLPGVNTSSEGSTDYIVRGGSMGQNLITLDESTVYGTSHLMGLFSVFNPDAIKDVTFYKGAIPASYGGRASSVLNITMNNGNSKKLSCTGGVGLVSAGLTFGAPIIKDRISFIVSGRRTYGDLLAKLFLPKDLIRKDMKFNFYDLNSKLNITINDKNRLFISGYYGNDLFEFGKEAGTSWGNKNGTIRLNHLFSEKFLSRTSVTYSKYTYGFIFSLNGMDVRSGIRDFSLKEDISWYINPKNTLSFGTWFTHHTYSPGEISSLGGSGYKIVLLKRTALDGGLYLQNEQTIASMLKVFYGLRISAFSQLGPNWFYSFDQNNRPNDSTWAGRGKLVFPYLNLEPRISINYLTSARSSLKISYTRLAQYQQLLSNSTTGSPADIWLPASNNLKPLVSDQVSAGYYLNFLDNKIETSVEIYYKHLTNSSDYEDGADLILNKYIESQIITGKGRSYGAEVFLKKSGKRLSGWLSYTISRSENKIKSINNYLWYPVRYDRTHDFSIVSFLNISRRLTFSAVWMYSTGNAVTFPEGKYIINSIVVPYYTKRNGYRMPSYHRLDVSLSLKGKQHKKFDSGWEFSIYNVYNRHNSYMINFRESKTMPGSTEAVSLSLFGIIPSLSYRFNF